MLSCLSVFILILWYFLSFFDCAFLYIFGYNGNHDICVFGFDGTLYLDLLSRYVLCVLSNYSSVSASITIHRLTQLFTLDCVSSTFLNTISADVVNNGSDEATYDGPEGVNRSDTVSIHAVAPGQSITTRFIVSADHPHAIRSAGVHPLAILQTLYENNQCLHV